MFLDYLKLTCFRNHAESAVNFTSKLSCITGNNGTGKTNLLDAVYFLCLTKSNLFATDQQSIRFGADFLRLEGQFSKHAEKAKVLCRYQAGKRKEFFVNEVPYTRLSEHIGVFPCMMISPGDGEIIIGGSEERRKVIDSTLSQTDGEYLELLLQYNKLLAQRNAVLKQFAESGRVDRSLLLSFDMRLIPIGEKVFAKRKNALLAIQPLFEAFYEKISLNRDVVSIQYLSQLEAKSFEALMAGSLQKDLVLQRTDVGIHKDDIELQINTVSAKKFGSQGQQKSVLIALKLALFQYVKQQKGFAPILLVDDIFDKLDSDRGDALIDILADELTGQVIISHTRSEDFDRFDMVESIAVEDVVATRATVT